jgi:hypothetical protein
MTDPTLDPRSTACRTIRPAPVLPAALLAVMLTACGDAPADRPAAPGASGVPTAPRIVVDSGPPLTGTAASGLSDDASVVPLPAGGFAAGPTLGEHQVLVYAEDGGLRHALGRQGSGPGEFRGYLRLLPFRGDSLAVFDGSLSRVSYLDPDDPDGAFRTVALPVQPTLTPFANWIRVGERWVTTGLGTERIFEEGPFHVLDFEGEHLASFGGTGAALQPEQPWGASRALAARGDTIWGLHYNAYRVEAWTVHGEQVDAFDVASEWFPPWTASPPGAPFPVRPAPATMGTWMDARGLLWVVALTAAEDWAPYPPEARERDFDATFINEIYGTRVEVLDPTTRTVLAQLRLEGRVRPTRVAEWLYVTELTDEGDLALRPLRLTLDIGGNTGAGGAGGS